MADKIGLHERVLLAVRRSAPFIYGIMVAIVTLLPSTPATKVRLLADQAIDFRVAFSYISGMVLSVFLIRATTKLKLILRFSWPLFAVIFGYAAIMIILILELLTNKVSDGLAYGPAWSDDLPASLDVHHAIIYMVFAVIAAVGWRDRIMLPVLGAILVTCGAVLEVWQEDVPGRSFRMMDIVSNSIGVVVGLGGVRLMDTLRGRSGKVFPASTTRRR